MTINTQKPLNHLELLRKYKYFKAIPADELRAAQVHVPKGESAIKCLFKAARAYENEVRKTAKATGSHPRVCFSKDGLCDDERCYCWEK